MRPKFNRLNISDQDFESEEGDPKEQETVYK